MSFLRRWRGKNKKRKFKYKKNNRRRFKCKNKKRRRWKYKKKRSVFN